MSPGWLRKIRPPDAYRFEVFLADLTPRPANITRAESVGSASIRRDRNISGRLSRLPLAATCRYRRSLQRNAEVAESSDASGLNEVKRNASVARGDLQLWENHQTSEKTRVPEEGGSISNDDPGPRKDRRCA